MYFNRKNAEQKNWRMIKKGKHFLFGCSLVFAVGAALVAPSVKAETVETKPEAGSTTGTTKPTAGEENVTYAAPAVEAPTVTESNAKPALASATEEAKVAVKATESSAAPVVATTKESDSVQAPSLTAVVDASSLTAEDISNVTEAIKGSNPTAISVQVSNDGSAVVTFADGSSATLSASQTVKVKPEATSTSEAPTRSRRALSPANGISTRSFDSELQDAAQKTAIYSPGEKGQKQSYAGTVWLYRNGSINNDNQEDAKRLANVNVYLQYVTGKGFVSPVYKTTSGEDGTFVFDLSKPVANRLGATGEFQLAGDPKLAIRTWVENPDPTKYTVIKSGDQRTGFHGRLSRLNETWDFTAGINRIVGGQVVLQEKPNSEDYLLKPEADRQTGDQADGQFSRKGDYGTIRGKVWYELRDPSGSDARMYKKDSYDINATNVKVAASYLNDEVTRLLDQWKKDHKNYKLDDFKAAQAKIIKEYEAKNGKGSHIAETVVVPVDKDGNYRIPFRGLYGVSADKANSGLSKKISNEEFGKLVRDEDLDNEHLMKWNGTIGQKYRHINTDYVYATVLVDDYAIWSNNYQSNMFEGTSDAVLPVGPSSLAAANISNTNFALIAPQPMHDILVYDNSDHFAKPGNTAESTTGGLMPSREYQIRWFKDGKAIGEATTVMSTAEGTAKSVPLTVPNDLTEAAIYTSAVFLQGEDTSDLHSALALDSFTAVPNEDADKYTPTAKDQTVNKGETPDAKGSIGNVSDLPSGTTFEYKTPVDTTTPGDKDATVVVTYPDGSKDEVPVKVTVKDPRTDADKNTPVAKDQSVNKGETPDAKGSIGNFDKLPKGTTAEFKTPVDTATEGDKDATVVVTYPDKSTDEVKVKVTVKDPRTDADKNTPVAKDQSVKPSDKPNAKDSIGNVGDLPSGTKFEYKTPVDTTTEGDKDVIVVVTYPDGSKDEVPVKVTVKDSSALTQPEITADLTGKAGTKTPVEVTADPGTKVELFDKDGNKIGEGVTGEDGKASITPTVEIPAGPVTAKASKDGKTSGESAPKVATKDPAITPVVNPSALTDAEKAKVADEVKKANPTASKVEVGNDGTATVTFPDGSVAVLTPEKTVKEADSNGVKIPAVTPVVNPSSLTDAEKAKVADEVKKANPTATDIKVNNDGSVVVTFADGSVAVLASENVVKEATKESSANPASKKAGAKELPNTGTKQSSASLALALLAAATGGLLIAKKREEEE